MTAPRLRSALCTEAQLFSPRFLAWAERLRPAWDHAQSGLPVLVHRKLWEWLFIVEALDERGMLEPGRRGLGFGVGREPLTALFASLGPDILATDLDPGSATKAGWVETDQYARAFAEVNGAGLCDPDVFAQRVHFREVDMNHVPHDLKDFDFTWSACAIEHLGSIGHAQEFVLNQMRCLRPGGVALHTTEYNITSDAMTVDWEPTVLFCRSHVEWLVRELRADGHMVDVDFDPGDSPADVHVDLPPAFTSTHLKVQFDAYTTTSLGLIIEKGAGAANGSGRGLVVRRLRRPYLDARLAATKPVHKVRARLEARAKDKEAARAQA